MNTLVDVIKRDEKINLKPLDLENNLISDKELETLFTDSNTLGRISKS